jgi:hypothetical protein
MDDIITREITIATAKIRAPDTTGTRAAKGHRRRHPGKSKRASTPSSAWPARAAEGSERPEADFQNPGMFGNLNMLFRTILALFHKALSGEPQVIDAISPRSIGGGNRNKSISFSGR